MIKRIDRAGLSATLLISFLSVLATASLCWPGVASFLVADSQKIADYELWRWITGPLVHATWGHLLRDLALLLFVGVAFERELGRRYSLLCLLGLVLPTIVSLHDPQIHFYYGSSGLTHALLAAVMLYILVPGRSQLASPSWMLAMAGAATLTLFGKVLWEVSTGAPLFPMDLGPGVHQLPIAHASGAAVGVLFFGASKIWDAVRFPGPPAPTTEVAPSRAPRWLVD